MSNNLNWSTIVELASRSPEFKKLLLENPRSAIEKATGVSLPADFEYVVHEQKPGTVHLVLPASTEEFVDKNITLDDYAKSAVYTQGDDVISKEILQSGVFVESDDAVAADIRQSGIFIESDDTLAKDALQSGVFLEADDAA